MLITMKDEITFIPKTTTVIRDREIFTTKIQTRQPRFLLGSYLTAQAFTIQQLGFSATLIDNKFRQYTFGKDVLSDTGWMLDVKMPLFYSKKK